MTLTVNRTETRSNEDGGVVLVGIDITARKAMEAQLMLAQKMESIGQLAAGIGETPTADEAAVLETHPQCGRDLLAKIPRLEEVAHNVSNQAKRFDGSGPPYEGIRGRQIPLGGRVLKIALDYDAVIQSGMTPEEAFSDLNGRRGWYDPEILTTLQQAVLNVRSGYNFQLISSSQLRIGMLLPDGVKTPTGNLVVGQSAKVTPAMLTKLQNFARFQGLSEPIRALVPRGHTVAPVAEPAARKEGLHPPA